MNTVKKMFTALAVCAMALLGVAATATTPAFAATAGSDGQQIAFCPGTSTVYGGAQAVGVNQDGNLTESPYLKLPSHGLCAELPNWWWVGIVHVHWTATTRPYHTITDCYVPLAGTGWVRCWGP
jgi:hypothetical protein